MAPRWTMGLAVGVLLIAWALGAVSIVWVLVHSEMWGALVLLTLAGAFWIADKVLNT